MQKKINYQINYMKLENQEKQNLLGKKRQNDNSLDYKEIKEIKEIKKSETILKLISLKNNRNSPDDYYYFQFSDSQKYNLDTLIIKKRQEIKLKINSTKIYKTFKIKLTNKKGNREQSFNLPIYINKINTCYINLRPKKKGYCFEYILYGNNELSMRKNLLYKKSIDLDEFDDYGLKYRKKINVINVEKNFSDSFLKKNIKLPNNSYKICTRAKDNGKELSSIHELLLTEKLGSETFASQPNLDDIKKIEELFKEFNQKKSLLIIKEEEKYKELINDEKAFNRFIKSYKYVDKSYLQISQITNDDVNILKEYLLKFVIKYFFIDIDEKEQIRLNSINNLILKVINNIQTIIKDIEDFTKDIENSTELKFRLFRATLYNLYSITKKKSGDKEACLEILSEYNQEIINIKERSDINPYFKAIKFLKDIANNLNEDSCLFDLLFQYNSGISNDINLFSKKRKKSINAEDTKFELSMLTVEELTNHIKEILPNIIIRYTNDDNTYGFYSSLNNLIFINEKKTFRKNIIEDFDGQLNYTLPIVFILLHECWGHKKVILSNEINKNTPIRYSLRNYNFDEETILILNENTGQYKGESGFEIEYLITGSKSTKNNIYSDYLLSHTNNNQDLLNVDLWVQPTFKDLRQKILEQILEAHKDDKNFDLNKYRIEKENEDNNTDKYNLKVYYEDDVKIGPFCKV